MKKFLLITGVLILMVIPSGCIENDNQTKHYEMGDISFDYPASWNITSKDNSKVTFSEGSYEVTVIEQIKPQGYSLKNILKSNQAGNFNKDFRLISTNNLTIDGIEAYQNNYRVNTGNGEKQRIEVWVEKNNKVYSVVYSISIDDLKGKNVYLFDLNLAQSKSSFNQVVNSIKIKNNSNASSQSEPWGEIIIPSINVDWWINSKSVNIASSVYHLPNSYYPGEKGEMAIMGHHTQHSAPFLNIDKLKSGDKVIIKDFLTQKKYTYEVESNGDVRWGVKAKHIDYKPSEEPKLLLITCYPPGFMSAAWIVHTKLVSVEPLD